MENIIIDLFLLYAMGVCSGMGFMLFVVWVMVHTGHDVNELWESDNYED